MKDLITAPCGPLDFLFLCMFDGRALCTVTYLYIVQWFSVVMGSSLIGLGCLKLPTNI